jgi:hypothetical protein
MVNKKHLHHIWTKFRAISHWYFLGLFVISLVIGVSAMRQNNLNMIELKEAVTQADKDNGDVETALRSLREYVYSHMNTNLTSGPNAIKPPIQLKYRYDRLLKAEQEKTAVSSAQIYSQAQAYCEQLYPQSFSGGPRVPCIQDYVTSHGVPQPSIPEALYKFDFVSPLWTPDLAGISLLAAAIFLFLFVLRLGLERWTRAELKRHI